MRGKSVLIFFLILSLSLIAANPYSFNLYDQAPSNVRTFLNLTDTPSSYSGAEGQCVTVNAGGTGLQFGNCSSINTTLIEGSVVFIGPGGNIAEDNDNFYWNDTSNSLGLGTNTPTSKLELKGDSLVSENVFRFLNSNGDVLFNLVSDVSGNSEFSLNDAGGTRNIKLTGADNGDSWFRNGQLIVGGTGLTGSETFKVVGSTVMEGRLNVDVPSGIVTNFTRSGGVNGGLTLDFASQWANWNLLQGNRYLWKIGGVQEMRLLQNKGLIIGGTGDPTHRLNVLGETNLSGETIVEGDINSTGNINLHQANDFDVSEVNIFTSTGRASFARVGPNIPQSAEGFGGNASGIINFNGSAVMIAENGTSILFGKIPNGQSQNITISMKLDENDNLLIENALLFQDENKSIYSAVIDGGSGLIFDASEVLSAGETPFVWKARNASGDEIFPLALQNGKNNSAGFWRNSELIFGDLGLDNLSILTNARQMWLNYGITSFMDYDTSTQGASLGVQYGIETQKIFIHGDLGEGQFLMDGGDFRVVSSDGNDIDLYEAPVHILDLDTRQVGSALGVNLTILDARFISSLSPFTLITLGKGIDEWAVTPNGGCPTGSGALCSHAGPTGGSGNTIMQTNISSLDLQLNNLSFNINTLDMASGGSFNVTMNNNSGSGDVEIYSLTLADELDQIINVSIPSEMDNSSLVSIAFKFLSIHPIRGDVWVDNILITATTTADTQVNQTFSDGEIKFGDESCRIRVNGTDNSMTFGGIGCGDMIFEGNTTFENVNVADQNVTGDITATGSITAGGSFITQLTEGSVAFIGPSQEITEDNVNFYWNDTSNSLGIGTNTPLTKLHLVDAVIWEQRDASGYTSLTQTSQGVALTAKAMNTANKYTPALKFGTTDAQITTENPKYLAYIAGYATENYASDGASGMGLSFQTTGNSEGTNTIPTERMVLDEDGNLGINTTSPTGRLTVIPTDNDDEDTITVRDDIDNLSLVELGLDGGDSSLIMKDESGNINIKLWADGNRISYILGKTGLGITDPTERVGINGNLMVGDSAWADDAFTGTLGSASIQYQLGVGTSSPDFALHVNSGTTNAAMKLESSDVDVVFQMVDDTTVNPAVLGRHGNNLSILKDGGFVGLGTASPEGEFHVVNNPGGQITNIIYDNYGAGAADAVNMIIRQSNSNTAGTITETTDGEALGSIIFQGVDTVPSFDQGVSIDVIQDGDSTGSHVPARINFRTGTTTPRTALSISAVGNVDWFGINSTSRVGRLFATDGANAAIAAENELVFYVANASVRAMHIDKTGEVGIGETAPQEEVHITSANPSIMFEDSDADAGEKVWRIIAGGEKLFFQTRSDAYGAVETFMEVERIAGGGLIKDVAFPNGNVGVGTTTPSGLIPNGWTNGTAVEINSGDTTTDAGIFLRRSTGTTGLDIWHDTNGIKSYIDDRYDNAASELHFRMRTNGGSLFSAMIIEGGGDVGIGTAPTQKLTVNGNILLVGGNVILPTDNGIQWASGGGSRIDFDSSGDIHIEPDDNVTVAGDLIVQGNITTNGTTNLSGNTIIDGNLTVNELVGIGTAPNSLYSLWAVGNIRTTGIRLGTSLGLGGSASSSTLLQGRDFIKFQTDGGIEKMRMDMNLIRFGINTSSPDSPLDIVGELSNTFDGTHAIISLSSTNTVVRQQFQLGADGRLAIVARDGGAFTEALTVSPTAKVGVNELSPDVFLHVTGDGAQLRLEHTSSSSNGGITLAEGATTRGTIQLIGSAFGTVARRNNVEIASTSGGDLILQRGGLLVGIGTDEPAAVLDIAATGRTLGLLRTHSSTTAALEQVRIQSRSTGDMDDGFGIEHRYEIRDDADVDNAIGRFQIYRDGADNEGAMSFLAGTDGAEEALTIHSDTSIEIFNDLTMTRTGAGTFNINASNSALMILNKGVDAADAEVQFHNAGVMQFKTGLDSSGSGVNDYAIKRTNNAVPDFVILHSTGFVGINVTAPTEMLEISTDANVNAIIGKAELGGLSGDRAYFAHLDQYSITNYALKQTNTGATSINAPTGQTVGLKLNDVAQLTVQTSGQVDILNNLNVTNKSFFEDIMHLESGNITLLNFTIKNTLTGAGSQQANIELMAENTRGIYFRSATGLMKGAISSDEGSANAVEIRDANNAIVWTLHNTNKEIRMVENVSMGGDSINPMMYVTDLQGVMIGGNTTPQQLLHLFTDDVNRQIRFQENGAVSFWDMGVNTGGDFSIVENAANTRFMILDGGFTGIGTVTPQEMLHVAGGDLRMDIGQRLEWGSTDASIRYTNEAPAHLRITESGADRLTIRDGQVGINITAPLARLHVVGASETEMILQANIGASNMVLKEGADERANIAYSVNDNRYEISTVNSTGTRTNRFWIDGEVDDATATFDTDLNITGDLDVSGGNIDFPVNGIINASGLLSLQSATSWVGLTSGTNQHQYFNAGNNFLWRDGDSGSAVRMTLESGTGNLNVTGDVEVNGDIDYVGGNRQLANPTGFIYITSVSDIRIGGGTGLGSDMFYDIGDEFQWRDADDSFAVRMNLDSATGNLNVTGNITTADGGTLWSNSTCTFLSSPDGSSVVEVCNA